MGLRISRDEMLMGMAKVAARRGTCDRLQVGAVVSHQGRIISTGYNGVASGLPHCDHSQFTEFIGYENERGHRVQDAGTPFAVQPGAIWATPDDSRIEVGCTRAVHAEQNAVAFAARYGAALEGADMHCTHSPCVSCANSIINAGIVRVVYDIPYRRTDGVELLKQAGLQVVDFTAWVR